MNYGVYYVATREAKIFAGMQDELIATFEKFEDAIMLSNAEACHLDEMHDGYVVRPINVDDSKNKIKFPYRTEVQMSGFENGEIVILKETEKAFFMCYSKSIRRGTSMVSDKKEFTFWCPKSIWNNDRNFDNLNDDSKPVVFNAPSFLLK